MTARFATPQEIAGWNKYIAKNPDNGSVFQTKELANIKQSNHWQSQFVIINDVYILILERKYPILGRYWYIPKGPGVNTASDLKNIVRELAIFAKSQSVFCVKLESEIIKNDSNLKALAKLGLPLSKPIQAANTVIIDITPTLDNIIAKFSSKTRYNIRQAQKAKITNKIVPINDENCRLFYQMMTATINGRSHVRSYDYFKNFWQTHAKADNGVFLFAEADGQVISTDFIMINGKKAARKDAASSRDHTVRGASALLEVFAIDYLKTRGVTDYDLYGSPPSDKIKDQSHPYYGFGTFKAGFNSEITDYVGAFDLVIKPLRYRYWRKIGERIAHKLYSIKYKDLYY